MDDAAVEKNIWLASSTRLELKPFDLAILAAVLTKGERLRSDDNQVVFATLDTDLQDWDRAGQPKHELRELYAQASVSVAGDFLIAPA